MNSMNALDSILPELRSALPVSLRGVYLEEVTMADVPPQINRPSDAIWLLGLGGAVALGVAIALTLRPPKEVPGARDYHKARLRGGYARG